jgi:hypothetical protein
MVNASVFHEQCKKRRTERDDEVMVRRLSWTGWRMAGRWGNGDRL